MTTIRFHLPFAIDGPGGVPSVGVGEIVVQYAKVVDFLADHFSVSDFEIRRPILSKPSPVWLGDVYQGRVIDLATTIRLFAHMVHGRGVHCVLASGSLLRIELSFDYFVYIEFADGEEEVALGLRSLGMIVEPAHLLDEEDDGVDMPIVRVDSNFWGQVREIVASGYPFDALVVERRAYGPFGQSWYRVQKYNLDQVEAHCRARSTVRVFLGITLHSAHRSDIRAAVESTLGHATPIIVLSAVSGFESRSHIFEAGIGAIIDDDLPEGDELVFFPYPESESDYDRFLEGVVPDSDGVVRASKL
jgi:hypothetical protein